MRNPLTLPVPELLLRVGVAFSFLYPPLSALGDPYSWIGYFPGFLVSLAGTNGTLMLHAFGVIEVLIALWILFGKNIFIPSLLAGVALMAIVVLNGPQFLVLFRDVSIALAAFALAYQHYPLWQKKA
ncbi:hypothetical protein K2Y00_02080 [Patescibacteria group bacterium]|nr:hypothetical protein [Patescibacteria group bacterium]